MASISADSKTTLPLKVMAVFGTRPEAIKMAPVVKELMRRRSEGRIIPSVCVTGQHREILDQVLDVFDIVPDYDLDLMTHGQSPLQLAARALHNLEPILNKVKPDWVIVQGDTTTAAIAALAAYYTGTKVAHVEAGLRTHDKWQPFPEEINRRIAGVISDIHFAPTAAAKQNLLNEGVSSSLVYITGNTVIDALIQIASAPPPPAANDLLVSMGIGEVGGPKLLLVTIHRRENFGEPLERICGAIRELCTNRPNDITVLIPVHPNPDVHEPVHKMLAGLPNVMMVQPLEYDILVHVMKASYLILTDSGGIQEEAPTFGKPVLVARNVTERIEAIESGVAKIVGTQTGDIIKEVMNLLDDPVAYDRMSRPANPFGDGLAGERIVAALMGEKICEFLPK
jgi:UDP-N-acetylglucosamine 2-epimerase (non-hydrolysing)